MSHHTVLESGVSDHRVPWVCLGGVLRNMCTENLSSTFADCVCGLEIGKDTPGVLANREITLQGDSFRDIQI